MAEIRSLVCDNCGAAEATGYTISKRPGAPWIIDLCDKCASPISSLSAKGRPPAGKKRQYRKYGTKTAVAE